MFREWPEIERFVSVDAVIEPHHYAVYEEQYRAYRVLYPALKDILG